MTTVRDLYNALFAFAPASMKYDWDNVGLLVGDPAQEVRRVLVALDITQGVAEEAVPRRADDRLAPSRDELRVARGADTPRG